MHKLHEVVEAIAGSKKHLDYPEGAHQAIVTRERRDDAKPLHKAADTEMKSGDKTQARYLKGLAVAVERGNREMQREFLSKLSKGVVGKYVPTRIVAALRGR